MKDLKREDIIEVLEDELYDIIDDVASDYNSSGNPQGEELEYKARSGYIPYIDGGYKYTFLSFAPQLEGSGIDLPTKVLQDKVEEFSKNADEHAQSEIWDDNKDEEFRDVFPTKEDINYSDLEEFDSSYAEEFDEIVRNYRDDESIKFSISAMYYNPENDYAEDGKNTITLTGSVNLEAPYHRRGFYEDFKEITFTFSSLESLDKKLRNELEVIKSWFEGSDYKTSTTELKQGRLGKGGVIIVSDEDGGEERVKGHIKVKIVDNLDDHTGYKEGTILDVEEIEGDDYMITKEGYYLSYAEVDFADKESQDVYSNIMNKRYDYAKGGDISDKKDKWGTFWKKSKELGQKGYKKSQELAKDANERRKMHNHDKREGIAKNVIKETVHIVKQKEKKGGVSKTEALNEIESLKKGFAVIHDNYKYPEGPKAAQELAEKRHWKMKKVRTHDSSPYFAKGGEIDYGEIREKLESLDLPTDAGDRTELVEQITERYGIDCSEVIRASSDDDVYVAVDGLLRDYGIYAERGDEYSKGGEVEKLLKWTDKNNVGIKSEEFTTKFNKEKTPKQFREAMDWARKNNVILVSKEFMEKHSGKYAKGGEVKKGNEMLIGGLAGFFIGMFFNK